MLQSITLTPKNHAKGLTYGKDQSRIHMENSRRGRRRGQVGNEENPPIGDPAEFFATMTNLANTVQAGAATTNEARRNNNQIGNGPMTLLTFLKVNSPTFKGSTEPTDADDWSQAMERALRAQQVPEAQYVEFAAYLLAGEAQLTLVARNSLLTTTW
ncbi:hypothetical protein PIB30_048197 [Stylosanthes scabra]|uniref:Uncharacterized protein n=1 Tax=Stylosanthes scabra TaxID=79078 RepID=A0ABU6YEB4_9FABA|nr:hypothetical protein [Stylosanthes scabra]